MANPRFGSLQKCPSRMRASRF